MAKSIKLTNNTYLDINSINQDFILASLGGSGSLTMTGYSQLQLISVLQKGHIFSISDGMIKVNKSGYYEISGQFHFQTVVDEKTRWLEIRNQKDTPLSMTISTISNRGTITASSTVAYLNSGDMIMVKLDCSNGDTVRRDYQYSWLYVKRMPNN